MANNTIFLNTTQLATVLWYCNIVDLKKLTLAMTAACTTLEIDDETVAAGVAYSDPSTPNPSVNINELLAWIASVDEDDDDIDALTAILVKIGKTLDTRIDALKSTYPEAE